MEVVINIDENVFTRLFDNGTEDYEIVNDDLFVIAKAIRKGTPLPKGHGRLIDANSMYQIVRPIEPRDAEWGMTALTAKRIVQDIFDRAPTIVEADKESEE